jgi:imidazole glycerol-phosphate synthase subunit HisF
MKKKRLIPVILLKNGSIVKSKKFSRYQRLGNPITSVKRLSEWASDELIYLDITKSGSYYLGRDDLAFDSRNSILDIIKDVSKVAFMPITVGGGISTLQDIEQRLLSGADKIAINTIAFNRPQFINEAAKEFGSQCIVVSIDYIGVDNIAKVYCHQENKASEKSLMEWVKQVEEEGAGEILLNAVDRDGMQNGYDISTLQKIAENALIPIIGCGGAGEYEHFREALEKTKIDAVAAANIFHYSDQSTYLTKKYLYEHGCVVRYPELLANT